MAIYEYQPSFVLGFHGCDQDVGEDILAGKKTHLKPSEKEYDWLGHGVYFWEGNPSRAKQWAEARKKQGAISTPFVLGAIIDLRYCLDLFDQDALQQVKNSHAVLKATTLATNEPMLKNVGRTPDKLGRKLDCAVLNQLHDYRHKRNLQKYDTVRGPFLEGRRTYPGAGFRNENHIQLCVRETHCIKGYFRVLPELPLPA